MQPPVMPEDGHTTRLTSGEDISSPAAGKDSSVLEALWDDEDTRAFYECLPDLRFAVARQSVNPVKKNGVSRYRCIFLLNLILATLYTKCASLKFKLDFYAFLLEHLFQQCYWERQNPKRMIIL
jgi:hypothetical protein